MAEQIGVSYASIRHYLDKMKNENIIQREGSTKSGKWVVIG